LESPGKDFSPGLNDLMEPYSDIAPVYDYLLRHVNYQEWYEYIKLVMNRYVDDPKIIVELGCGTGRFGAKFSGDGYTIIGVDRSLDMLRVARTRAYANFRIFCADITDFTLARPADFIFAVHDTMNYLLDEDDILHMLESVRSIMSDKSVFMFDITTEYNIKVNFDMKTAEYTIQDKKVEWSNRYDHENRLVYSTLKIFKDGEAQSVEEHVQRIYTVESIKALLEKARFSIEGIYGDHSFMPPKKDTIMINVITRKR
jgi:SAM-dependent methyltransferase